MANNKANFKNEILDIINNLNKNLSKISIKDDVFFEDYFKDIEEFSANAENELSLYIQKNNELNLSNDAIDKQTQEQTDAVKERYRRDISELNINTETEIRDLNKKIENEIITTNNLYKSNKDEKLLINSTTNPYIYKHLIDRNSNIEKYDLEKKNIINKYNEIVYEKTKAKNNTNRQTLSNNNRFMYSYNEASNNVIASMNNKLKEYQKKIDHINVLLNELRLDYDRTCLNIEKSFNRDVLTNKVYVKEIKHLLLEQYNEDRRKIAEEKSLNDEKNNQQRSNAVKEFAKQISSLNDRLDSLENNKRVHTFENSYIYDLNIFDYNTKIRNLKIDMMKKPDHRKENNALIKKYNHAKKIEANRLKKKLKTIKMAYAEKFDAIDNEKILYEKIKNSQLDKLIHVLSIEDNAYHNKLHILQLKYDYDISKIDKHSEYEIKKYRCKYDEQKLDVTKDYKIKQTNLFEQKQTLIHEANLVQDEIEMAKKLNEQVIVNNKQKIDNVISKTSIEALLEIEKNDMLTAYNIEEKNIDIEKELKKYIYNEQKEFTERDRKNSIIDVNLEKATLTLEHNKTIFNLEKEKVNAKYEYETKMDEISNTENASIIRANYAAATFSNRKKKLLILYETNAKVITSLTNALHKLMAKFLNTRYSNNEMLNSYIDSFQKIIQCTFLALKKLFIIDKATTDEIIQAQINLETGAKYKSLFEALKRSYDEDIKEINDREQSFNKTIKNYNNGIRRFYTNISLLDSNLDIIKKKFYDNKLTKNEFTKQVLDIKNEHKRLQVLIDKNEIQIDVFRTQLERLPREKELVELIYNKKKNKLIKKQQDESSVLYSTLEALDNFFNHLNDGLNTALNYIKPNDFTPSSYFKKVSNYLKYVVKVSNKSSDSYLSIIENLESNFTNKYEKLLKQNNISYLTQSRLIGKKYLKQLDSINERIDEENDKFAEKLKDNQDKMKDVLEKYEKLADTQKNNYDNEITLLNNRKTNSYNHYYDTTTAIKQSLLQNVSNTRKNEERLENINKNNNKNLVKKYILHKSELEFETKKKFEDFKETKTLIPIEHRSHTKNLDHDFFEYSKLYNIDEHKSNINLHREIKSRNKEAARYSNEIHNKIIRCNLVLSKSRKALTQAKILY